MFLQGYIQLTAESPGVLTPIELPQTDSGPFLSYALQWAAFGVIALIGLGVFIYREAADPRPPDDHVDASAPPTGDEPGDEPTASRRSAGRGTGSTGPSCMTSEPGRPPAHGPH